MKIRSCRYFLSQSKRYDLFLYGFICFVLVIKIESSSAEGNSVDFTLPEGYHADAVYTPSLQSPMRVAISPSGDICVVDIRGENILQIHENGDITEYAKPTTLFHQGIAFDHEGNLYFADGHDRLWKITSMGSASIFALGVKGFSLDADPSGSIFAVGYQGAYIQKVTPNGRVSTYASGFHGACDVGVNPLNGDVYVLDWLDGVIWKVHSNGTIEQWTSGLPKDASYIAFSPTGNFYHMAFSGLSEVSTTNGNTTPVNWIQQDWAGMCLKDLDFDSQGRFVAVDHTYSHVLRYDMTEQTAEVLYFGTGNSSALAVAPNQGGVFFGISHPLCSGDGRVVKVEDDGSITTFIDDLLPEVNALAFNAEGVGFVSTMLPVPGGYRSKILKSSPDGTTEELITLPYTSKSLAIDPDTGFLWGTGESEIWYLDGSGNRHIIPFSIPEHGENITFTPDGTLYAYAITSDINSPPVAQGVYQYDPVHQIFGLTADLTTVNLCNITGFIGGGQDGFIYWVGYGDRYTPNHSADMHMLRISSEGDVMLFGQQLPIDPLSVTGCWDNTDIYFSSGGGIYRIYEETNVTDANNQKNENPTSDFFLFQNYPNPFNPSTNIEYILTKPCKVNLIVYNTVGQVFKELVNSNQQPGQYSIDLNLQEAPSGLYFYEIKMGDFQAAKKMMRIE